MLVSLLVFIALFYTCLGKCLKKSFHLFYFSFYFKYMGLLPTVCMCSVVMPNALQGQKRWMDPLQLEIQIVVGCHVVLGIRFRSYKRVESTFNQGAFSPAPFDHL